MVQMQHSNYLYCFAHCIWHSLPNDVANADSLISFKKQLKTNYHRAYLSKLPASESPR